MTNFMIYFDSQEMLALGYFAVCWFGYGFYGERRVHKSLLAATNRYRYYWMQEMLKRDNRSIDIINIGNLQKSITFLASTTIFILVGLMTLLSYHERASAILTVIPFAKEMTPFLWEAHIFLLIVIFIYAFFKFTWSLRQYNYAGIYVAAMPAHTHEPERHPILAEKGAMIIGNAAKHFHLGLRAYYFGLGTLAWFIHPYLFMAATTLVILVAYRREFRSSTLKYLKH